MQYIFDLIDRASPFSIGIRPRRIKPGLLRYFRASLSRLLIDRYTGYRERFLARFISNILSNTSSTCTTVVFKGSLFYIIYYQSTIFISLYIRRFTTVTVGFLGLLVVYRQIGACTRLSVNGRYLIKNLIAFRISRQQIIYSLVLISFMGESSLIFSLIYSSFRILSFI